MAAPALEPDFRPAYHELHRVGRPGWWRSVVGSVVLLALTFLVVPTLIGLAFSVLGGYVCARIARRNEMKLGAAVAVVGIVLGELIGGDSHQLGVHLSLILSSIVAVMVGARLGYAKNRGTK